MAQAPVHQVFISFHEEDIAYKRQFVRLMGARIIDKSVDTHNIDDTGMKTARIRQKIRDEYIRDANVTVVLIGPRTWRRRHVDWEIGASIRKTRKNPRCGLLGIILPNHSDYGKAECNLRLLPPRLADNCGGSDPYARIYAWLTLWNPDEVARWIDRAFTRREGTQPNNSRQPFAQNRSGNYLEGWK